MSYEKQWLDLMKGEDGSFNQRVLEDKCEKAFWENYLKNIGNTEGDAYAELIRAEVLRLLGDKAYASILEVGPGWGNYTFSLARRCECLTCLDMSSDILDFIGEKAKAQGLFNIERIEKKLEDFEQTGVFDVVFAYNCFYRIRAIKKALKKIDAMAKDICIIGMNSQLDRPSFIDFEKKLGLKVRRSRLSHELLAGILGEMGIEAQTRLIRMPRHYGFQTLDEAVAFEKGCILSPIEDEDAIRSVVAAHYLPRGQGFTCQHEMVAGLVYWKK